MRNVDPDFQTPSVFSPCRSFAPSFMSVIASICAFAPSTKALRLSWSVTWAAVTCAPAAPLADMISARTARTGAALRFSRICIPLYGCDGIPSLTASAPQTPWENRDIPCCRRRRAPRPNPPPGRRPHCEPPGDAARDDGTGARPVEPFIASGCHAAPLNAASLPGSCRVIGEFVHRVSISPRVIVVTRRKGRPASPPGGGRLSGIGTRAREGRWSDSWSASQDSPGWRRFGSPTEVSSLRVSRQRRHARALRFREPSGIRQGNAQGHLRGRAT